ncbi:hypothetical protein MNB_SV-10-1438 [hydrothermal vent metagenome]|uniref:Uncharacterized protein n=1 Tax=hydrothermal vent metagenome TaxID=652676 RepID=A0A1W1CB00_9ZZZZ
MKIELIEFHKLPSFSITEKISVSRPKYLLNLTEAPAGTSINPMFCIRTGRALLRASATE